MTDHLSSYKGTTITRDSLGCITLIRTVVGRTVVYVSHVKGAFRAEKYIVRDGHETFAGYADSLPEPRSWLESCALNRHYRYADWAQHGHYAFT